MSNPKRFRGMELTEDEVGDMVRRWIERHYEPDDFGWYPKRVDTVYARAKRLLPLWRQLGLRELHDATDKAERGRQEARQLLIRMVKYVREDQAVTPGVTRLARLTDQVADYLRRTHQPSSVLRELDR